MSIETIIQGGLFSSDFLKEAVTQLPEWQEIPEGDLNAFRDRLNRIVGNFPAAQSPNESQTEDDLIWPVLEALGWTASLRQQNLASRGREDVPDGLLFADDAAKTRANSFAQEWRRYGCGLCIVESKRWDRPLDRTSSLPGEVGAPSSQMLRYLRRAEERTEGALDWGILTNGVRWRLYYQRAHPVSEKFFEINLAAVLDLPGHDQGLFALDEETRLHALKLFFLIFGRQGFLPSPSDARTFHQRALDEGRFYEERVAESLSEVVFGEVFPELVRAIANAAPSASLEEVRQAALILLYRLLFILYAEDRSLLPVRDSRYDDYGLRERVRGDVRHRKETGDTFSRTAARYWNTIQDLCLAIDQGDSSIGLPPYNGGLFDEENTPLLPDIRLGDAIMADVIDALSFERTPQGRKYINYRDLSVQQLGSIYERLLEQEVVHEPDDSGATTLVVRPNPFARKGSGSYYTPEDLVRLILEETIGPLVDERMQTFLDKAAEPAQGSNATRLARLRRHDPAERLLELKVCDPAMGSGHFLVSLVDTLAYHVTRAMADAAAAVDWADYVSPLAQRIEDIRMRILLNAEESGWTIDEDQLDDRHIIRRMVLKRCIYGVDKNPMAVELAKVALWLHTFTVGAPLSFLDHHLRCGDSLFGSWVRNGIDKATAQGSPLLLHAPLRRATSAAQSMQIIESLTDAEIAEAHRSASIFEEVREMTAPLDAFLSLVHAFDWLHLRGQEDRAALHAFYDGQFGDPIEIALEKAEVSKSRAEGQRFSEILDEARQLVAEERFLNWQVIFPGIWQNWDSSELEGGFDAVIGNPPWDRVKLQQVEWFAERRRDIAMAPRASDRKRMINQLEEDNDPLAEDYARASARAAAATRMARSSGDYPLLSGGDVNLYSLFVERAMTLVKPQGMVGLLTPSGIASDMTAARFFKKVATEGRLKALYDFENKKVFFPDIHASFKFCVFVASRSQTQRPANCAFYLHSVHELMDANRRFTLTAEDFARVNPNTGTAPIFRSRRDAELTKEIYARLPVLVDRSGPEEVRTWPVKYIRMFDMTNDSGLFRTRSELEGQEGAWPVGGNRFGSAEGDWVPLYEGKMVQAFDHRAASIVVNRENQHRPAQPVPASEEQHLDPAWLPDPQYWLRESDLPVESPSYFLVFKDVTASTNIRSMIASMIPAAGVGNTLPVILEADHDHSSGARQSSLLLGNLNSIVFDFVARQKIQGQHLNWYIVEQLPVIPLSKYEVVSFGAKSAADIVRETVLELTYTAHDMAPFAREMGYVDEAGEVKPPFIWDAERRLKLRARLDALYFHLYGVTDRDDVRHIFSTFPIVERQETAAYGRYRSSELCLAWINALAAGQPDAEIDL